MSSPLQLYFVSFYVYIAFIIKIDEDTSWITSSVLKLIYVLKSKNYVTIVVGNLIYENES